MPQGLEHWAARSVIVLALAVAYLWLVSHSISWVTQIGWSLQPQPTWWMYTQLGITHLLAVLIAALPIAMLVALSISQQPLRHALALATPTAATLVYDVFIGYPEALLGPRSTGEVVLALISVLMLLTMPAALTWLIQRWRPAPGHPAVLT